MAAVAAALPTTRVRDRVHGSLGAGISGLPRSWEGGCRRRSRRGLRGVRALVMQPSGEHERAHEFAKRLEQVWGIRKQPQPVPCETCTAQGFGECPWCRGTGFFILGDNMLCEVPSRNTSCHICDGKGTLPCDDCKGTGYRAKWMAMPHRSHKGES